MKPGTVEEAIRLLREDPVERERLVDAYYEPDPVTAARAFAASAEFAAVRRICGPLDGRELLDLGAGNGIASYAFARAGARVTALEPDPSELVGHGAIRLSCAGLPVEVVDAFGEKLPEHAWPLPRYLAAIRGAPLDPVKVLGHYDSVINAFPETRVPADLRRLFRRWLWRKYSVAGPLLGLFPSVRARLGARRAAFPGRLFTFVARKPDRPAAA